MKTNLTGRDINAIEIILMRARAQAKSERNDADRLFLAYGDKRPEFESRIASSDITIETVDRLLPIIRALRGYDAR